MLPSRKPIPQGTACVDTPSLADALLRTYGVLRRRQRLIVAAIAVCFLLAVLYLLRTPSLYAATSSVLILERGGHPLKNTVNENASTSTEQFEAFLPTQMAILRSPRVVEHAIRAVGVRNLPTLWAAHPSSSMSDLAQYAIKNYLTVSRPDRVALIAVIEYRAGSSAEAVRMVDALMASYQTFLSEHFQNTNSEVVALISKARDQLNRELEEAQSRYLEFQKHHPLLVDDEVGRSLTNSRLLELDRAANDTNARALRLKSQLEVGRKLADAGAETWSIAYAIAQIGTDPGAALISELSDAKAGRSDYVRQLKQERNDLAARLGPDYSKVKELNEEVSHAQGNGASGTEGAHDLIVSIEQGLAAVESMRSDIAKQIEGELDQANKTAGDLAVGRSLRDNLERTKGLFASVVEQLKRARFGGDLSQIQAQTVEVTNASERPVSPRAGVTLLAALLAGSLLGTAVALTVDSLDSRVHSLRELQALLGFRLLGTVPLTSLAELTRREPAAGRFTLTSPLTEAYSAIRTKIEFTPLDRRPRLFLVASALSGEGRSTTASHLAVSLARAGKHVLLIDADLRNPSLHRIFDLPRDRGLVHVLRGLLPAHRTVRATAVPGLDLVPAGPQVDDPTVLLLSNRLTEFLAWALERYDTLIVDTPPALSVSDAVILATHAEGIVFVVRSSQTRRSDAARLAEVFQDVTTPVVGTVVNALIPEPLEAILGNYQTPVEATVATSS